jgi:hypothetical protein
MNKFYVSLTCQIVKSTRLPNSIFFIHLMKKNSLRCAKILFFFRFFWYFKIFDFDQDNNKTIKKNEFGSRVRFFYFLSTKIKYLPQF